MLNSSRNAGCPATSFGCSVDEGTMTRNSSSNTASPTLLSLLSESELTILTSRRSDNLIVLLGVATEESCVLGQPALSLSVMHKSCMLA